MTRDSDDILRISGLTVEFGSGRKRVPVIRELDLSVGRGEILAIVGESGCGKSMTGLSIMRLVPDPPGVVAAGRILFGGGDLLGLSESAMQDIRGEEIAMVFQEPMTALNPVFSVGQQITETIRRHKNVSRQEARRQAIELLREVGISEPERRVDQFPHELSGGMRQRVVLAIANSCRPRLIIADEPTTALDVTVQAQILELLLETRRAHGTTIVLISHDIGVVAEVADRVAVMYAGRLAELGPVDEILERPRHPYTIGLLNAVVSIERENDGDRDFRAEPLTEIPGTVPDLATLRQGCAFASRCPQVVERCRRETPSLPGTGAHQVACWVAGAKPEEPGEECA